MWHTRNRPLLSDIGPFWPLRYCEQLWQYVAGSFVHSPQKQYRGYLSRQDGLSFHIEIVFLKAEREMPKTAGFDPLNPRMLTSKSAVFYQKLQI